MSGRARHVERSFRLVNRARNASGEAMINRDNRIVTVFGGGGFIGRYLCEELFERELRVRVACRNPRTAHFIQPLATVGQWGLERADVTNVASVRWAVKDAGAVINLTGAFGRAMRSVHVEGARNVAEAARDAGAASLVHISAIGADPRAEAVYGRTKGEGEQAVRDAFPGATIIRPSLVFGPEDDLTNRLAALSSLPVLPVIASKRQFQPVFVEDLAKAIAIAALDPATYGGQTFEIGGPQAMSMEDIYRVCARSAGREPELLDMPNAASAFLSWFGFLPGAPLSRDQWKMLQWDNMPGAGMKGLEAFGIEPTALGSVAPQWLVRFRPGGRWAARAVQQGA